MGDDARPPQDDRRRAPRPCPICQAMSLPKHHPFCSQRCADVDLSRWLKGVYAVPAREDDEAENGPDKNDDGL
ncbi:DNA gyrase inhibitor YacG [Methylopila musalis]|uniref:DNA gyrase inhibitor YacG n=1 Tax=Methylopila musalis TaxID=1134781 RepID=A0ABW3Z7X9_9HYPH